MCDANIPLNQTSSTCGMHPALVLCPSWLVREEVGVNKNGVNQSDIPTKKTSINAKNSKGR
jgi:hypothetical protein